MIETSIKELRTALGCSQTEMAKRLRISLSGFANYELGVREPSADVLQGLARMAAKKQLPELARKFQDAFSKEIEGRTGPVTTQEKAWVNAVLLLLRTRGLSSKITDKIIDELYELRKEKPDDEAVRVALLQAYQNNETSPAADIMSMLVAEYMAKLDQNDLESRSLAWAQVARDYPEVFAKYLAERDAKAAKRVDENPQAAVALLPDIKEDGSFTLRPITLAPDAAEAPANWTPVVTLPTSRKTRKKAEVKK